MAVGALWQPLKITENHMNLRKLTKNHIDIFHINLQDCKPNSLNFIKKLLIYPNSLMLLKADNFYKNYIKNTKYLSNSKNPINIC